MQTTDRLLNGAKILPKSSTLWDGATTLQTDRQTDRRQMDGSCYKANALYDVRLQLKVKL